MTNDPLDQPVDVLEVATRTITALANNDCRTLRDVVAMSAVEWMRTPNFGRVSLQDLKEALTMYGLALRADNTPRPPPPPPTVEERLRAIEYRLALLETTVNALRIAVQRIGGWA